VLCWTAPKGSGWKNEATAYVVYRFGKGETVDTDNPARIQAIVRTTHYELPLADSAGPFVYAVTALDRLHNESKPVKVKVKL
jgi:hypothetical protein